MSKTLELPPRPSGEEEIEQLRDVPTSNSDIAASASATGSYFGAIAYNQNAGVSSPRGRNPSFGLPSNSSLSASNSMPSTLSPSSSFGGNSVGGSNSQGRFSGTGSQSPHASIGGDNHGGYLSSSFGREFENFNSGSLSGYASPSVQSHSGTMTPAAGLYNISANTSFANVALKYRKPFARRVLKEGEKVEKPWLEDKKRISSNRKAYWIFIFGLSFGIVGAILLMYFAYAGVPKGKYCLVLDEQFDGDTINKDIWFHELETGGFGNGQFDWTTDSTNNSFVQDGKLYIVPTLTADNLGEAAITNGYTLNLTQSGQCTASNKTDANCAVVSNSTTGVVLPPIQSARLMTNFSRTIKYGRVEVKARMPTGDWIWPAVWMMPKDSVYGPWPRSGEIDIFEGRGNLPKNRDSEGTNKMQSTLHFGPNYLFDGYGFATKARNLWRDWFNQGSHTFGLEWTEDKLWTWEHSPVFKNLQVTYGDGFWKRGKFPNQMTNGTLLSNPWASVQGPHANAAPFDQEFYLILNVAVGGTNGYFQDGLGDDKPWSNDARNARAQFWESRDRWLPTWPTDPRQRGMEIEYVKMWQKC
ncbi:related to beta-1,3-glucan binding protein [Ustilago trichophora]|uniref:Related to beta-1,3-glucan binding protein n=1 Tax=Ustilago trichophora TaxID=86804 RepID=A0A5C3EC68_9BASI|nr:related to beta-1,3-glucan binding protein [Ustilago trichophora]